MIGLESGDTIVEESWRWALKVVCQNSPPDGKRIIRDDRLHSFWKTKNAEE